ncbi:alpha-glycosidase [Paraliobacillus sediminis]|uniref:alpha-glycosidase n=1 Tax=Paraliobacillus sediminis TaxID=1885916 RepID=UPI000E3B608A|nr:alpha-glycosidase [Paraliobacillus sediminis]
MLLEAIKHRSVNPYVYGKNENEISIMIETSRNDMKTVELLFGDPYDFPKDKWKYTTKQLIKTGESKLKDYWKLTIPPKYRRLRYGFRCIDQDNQEVIVTEKGYHDEMPDDIQSYFCFPYLHKTDIFQAPEWVKDTVWYQIFPERFANGDSSTNPDKVLPWGSTSPKQDNFFGGDFKGIINHLDYLQKLGISGLYLCPIFKAHSNHKYDTIDYMEIDPQFGDKETFRELVKQCHQRGIRVMLDAVFNHSGFYFEPFQDVLAKGEKSQYKDWFHIWDFPVQTNPLPNYDAFGFVSNMPKLNTENPDVKDYLLEVARYWIEEFDIDGWRLDVANEIDHDFWRDFRRVVKAVKSDTYILGEVWHDSMPWLQGDQFDAVMNYPFTTSVIDFFAKDEISTSQFANQITDLLHMYPDTVNETAFNLLDSHDTARILTLANEEKERIRLLYVFHFSFIGTPCIYYGDEIGMSGGEEPSCRACMEWDESKQYQELFQFIQQLIKMRTEITAFGNQSTFRFLQIDDQEKAIVYEKQKNHQKVVFVLNNHKNAKTIAVETLNGKDVKECFSGQRRTFDAKATVKLAPFGFACFQIL